MADQQRPAWAAGMHVPVETPPLHDEDAVPVTLEDLAAMIGDTQVMLLKVIEALGMEVVRDGEEVPGTPSLRT